MPQAAKASTPEHQPNEQTAPVPRLDVMLREVTASTPEHQPKEQTAPPPPPTSRHKQPKHPPQNTNHKNKPPPSPSDVMLRAVAAEHQPQEQTAQSPATSCHKRPKHPPQNTNRKRKRPKQLQESSRNTDPTKNPRPAAWGEFGATTTEVAGLLTVNLERFERPSSLKLFG